MGEKIAPSKVNEAALSRAGVSVAPSDLVATAAMLLLSLVGRWKSEAASTAESVGALEGCPKAGVDSPTDICYTLNIPQGIDWSAALLSSCQYGSKH